MPDPAPVPRPLPKGRHSLSREEVTQAQRLRLAVAMAEAMAERGYVGTSVAHVLARAGVSRQTFYELYDDKLAAFLDALDLVGEVLLAQLQGALAGSGDPLLRAERAVDAYLASIAEHPAFARLFLVEVHAAGPEAMRRRATLQGRIVDALNDLVGARTSRARFAGQAFVAAISSLVALPVVTGDTAAIRALRRPLREELRRLAGPR